MRQLALVSASIVALTAAGCAAPSEDQGEGASAVIVGPGGKSSAGEDGPVPLTKITFGGSLKKTLTSVGALSSGYCAYARRIGGGRFTLPQMRDGVSYSALDGKTAIFVFGRPRAAATCAATTTFPSRADAQAFELGQTDKGEGADFYVVALDGALYVDMNVPGATSGYTQAWGTMTGNVIGELCDGTFSEPCTLRRYSNGQFELRSSY